MPKVHFVNEMITVEVPAGTSLREVAIAQGIELYRGMWTHFNCLGNGVCGRCRLWVLSPGVSSPTLRERAHRVIRGQLRLACQVRVLGDVQVRTRALGKATVQETPTAPSYREQAEERLRQAREEAKEAERKAAEKKAADEKAAAAKKAAEEKAAAEKAAAQATAAEEKPAGSEAKPAAGTDGGQTSG